jgi:hypothetical protein
MTRHEYLTTLVPNHPIRVIARRESSREPRAPRVFLARLGRGFVRAFSGVSVAFDARARETRRRRRGS